MKDPFSDDLTAQPVTRALLERDVQSACVDHARSRGWWARKFQSPANRSVPDYLFAFRGFKFAVEFKAPRKAPTEAQAEEHAKMRAAGWLVLVIDDVARFKKELAEIEAALTGGMDVAQR